MGLVGINRLNSEEVPGISSSANATSLDGSLDRVLILVSFMLYFIFAAVPCSALGFHSELPK